VHIQIDHGQAQLAAGPAALDFSKRSLDLLFSFLSRVHGCKAVRIIIMNLSTRLNWCST